MKILILGGGWQQLPAILRAKRMGLQVVVADYLENVPGRKEADISCLVSTTDREKILKLARAENIDGVLAYASDPAAATAAYVAKELHLPGNPLRAAEILGNKAKFREFLQEMGIPTPKMSVLNLQNVTELCTGAADSADGDADGDVREFHYPFLIKPLDSSGSKGITLLRKRDPTGLFRAYRTALSYSRSGQALAEEYIPYGYSNLIGGDVVVRDGRIVCLGLMDCIREGEDGLVPCGKIWPSQASQEIKAKIIEILEFVIEKLQISAAELNVEFIAGRDGMIYPIEIALRCGGNGIPQLLSDATGQDWMGEEIRRVMRTENARSEVKTGGKTSDRGQGATGDAVYVTWNLHTDRGGFFAGYEISESLKQFCYRSEIFCRKGDEVISFHHAGGILGILYFRFADWSEAEEKIRRFQTDILVHVISKSIENTNADLLGDQGVEREMITFLRSEETEEDRSVALMYHESEQRKGIRCEILRLGEYMNPTFSARKQYGWDPSAYARKLTENAVIYTARDENNCIIGLIAAYLNRLKEAFISMLVVEPKYRRCMVAEKLCHCVQRTAKERGILQIGCEIREENRGCQMLANKLGYLKVERRKDSWRYVRSENIEERKRRIV